MLNEDYLTEKLSGESKKKFLEFSNAWSVVNGTNFKVIITSLALNYLMKNKSKPAYGVNGIWIISSISPLFVRVNL